MFAYFLAIGVAIMWGLGALMEHNIVKKYSSNLFFIITGLCYFFVAFCLYIYNHKHIGDSLNKLNLQDLLFILFTALIALVLSNLLFLFTLKNTDAPHIITAICFTAPVFSLIGAVLILKYKISYAEILGIILSIIGILILSVSMRKI